MTRILRLTASVAAFGFLTVSVMVAQTQKSTPEFEVASIRIAGDPNPDVRTALEGPTQVSCVCDLSTLVYEIFRIPFSRIQAPSWSNQVFYEIKAKVPEGTPKEAIPKMLLHLLEKRLHLVLREESRDVAGYALEIQPKGLQAKSAPSGEPPRLYMNRQPFFAFHGAGGRVLIEGRLTFEKFASLLTPVMERPVLDRTNRGGEFQVYLDATVPTAAEPAREPIHLPDGRVITPSASSIFSEIQKMGLKLQSGKYPVKFVTIVSADRQPSEN